MSAERPPEQRREFLVSPETKRHAYIGIMGATGAGKSELGNTLEGSWSGSAEVCREVYPDNPWLESFYEIPEENSFRSQTFFLVRKIEQMKQVRDLLGDKIQIHDPALWLDTEVYAFVHHEMGFMSNDEYETYMMAAKTLSEASEIPEPDIIIATIAPPDIVCQRIEDRGRNASETDREIRMREVRFMERHPDYFPRLSTRVIEWIDQNPHGVPIIPIDSERFNYVLSERDRNAVIGEIRAGLSYELFNPRGRNGVGRDGAKLIFPKILTPRHISDRAPSSMKPGRVR